MPSEPSRSLQPRLRGRDLEDDLLILPDQAAAGLRLLLAVHRGEVEPTEVQLDIPAGVADGTRLRVPGLGLQDQGDLFLTVRIDKPKGPRVVKAQVVGPGTPSSPAVAIPSTPSSDDALDQLMEVAAAPEKPLPPGVRREGTFLIQEPAPASTEATTSESSEADPIPPTSTSTPVAERGAWLTPVLWLVWFACLGLVIWGDDLDIVRGLDRERPEDVIVEVGVPKTIRVGTPQQSVQGYYRMDTVTATFTADGETTPHPIEAADVGGRKWGDVIQYREHVMKDAVVEPTAPIALSVKVTIPPELAQQAKGGRIDFAFTISFPWLVSAGEKRSFEEKAWSADHQVTLTLREPGTPRPSMPFRYIVLALLVGLFPFGIVRANAGAKAQIIAAVILTVLALIGYGAVQMKYRQTAGSAASPDNPKATSTPPSDAKLTIPTPDQSTHAASTKLDALNPASWTASQELSYRATASAFLKDRTNWEGYAASQPYMQRGAIDAASAAAWPFPLTQLPLIGLDSLKPKDGADPKRVGTWGPFERHAYHRSRKLILDLHRQIRLELPIAALAVSDVFSETKPTRWGTLMQAQDLGEVLDRNIKEHVAEAERTADATLATLAQQEGFRLLDSGLVLGPIRGQGHGPHPGGSALVLAKIEARYPDGTLILARSDQQKTLVGSLPPGLREVLGHLRAGESVQAHLPPRLARDLQWQDYQADDDPTGLPLPVAAEIILSAIDGAYPIDPADYTLIRSWNTSERLPVFGVDLPSTRGARLDWQPSLSGPWSSWSLWQQFSYVTMVNRIRQDDHLHRMTDQLANYSVLERGLMDRLAQRKLERPWGILQESSLYEARYHKWPPCPTLAEAFTYKPATAWDDSKLYYMFYAMGAIAVHDFIQDEHLHPEAAKLAIMHTLTVSHDPDFTYPLHLPDLPSRFRPYIGGFVHVMGNRSAIHYKQGFLGESIVFGDDQRTLGEGLTSAKIRIRRFRHDGRPLGVANEEIIDLTPERLDAYEKIHGLSTATALRRTRLGETARYFIPKRDPMQESLSDSRAEIKDIPYYAYLVLEVSVLSGS